MRGRPENPIAGHWGREMNRLCTISTLLATLVCAGTAGQMYATAGSQQYSVTDVGVLSTQHPYSTVFGINSSGQAVGQSTVSNGVNGDGYYYPGNGAPWSTLER